MKKRAYILYVCQTQEQADEHVGNIASLLEREVIARYYPELGTPALNKFGAVKGWRRNRLRTASGLTVDALGLDSAARGAKVDDDRPGLIILDDIDGELDGPIVTGKKIKVITRKLLPAGAVDCAVLAVQNLVHKHSVFSRLAGVSPEDERADFLADRIVSGPYKAVNDLEYEEYQPGKYRIIKGTPLWGGQSIQRCQEIMNDVGPTSFLIEHQQEVEEADGGMFSHLAYQHIRFEDLPVMREVTVWVDPAVTDSDDSDSQGVQADGIGVDGKIYRLYSWEGRTSPLAAMMRAVTKAVELHASSVGVETNQGGDTWITVYNEACRRLRIARPPQFLQAKAGGGLGNKAHRASLMLADYERAIIVHVYGTHLVLERALKRFWKFPPHDLVDASVWSWKHLSRGRLRARIVVSDRKPEFVPAGMQGATKPFAQAREDLRGVQRPSGAAVRPGGIHLQPGAQYGHNVNRGESFTPLAGSGFGRRPV